MIAIFGSATAVPDVTFKNITIANGNITTGLNAGGAIQNFGRLTLDTVTVRNSRADGSGAIFQEPCNGCLTPSLTVTRSLFLNNSHSAISMEGGTAAISDSTFTGNASVGSGAIDVFSNSTFKVNMSIDRCTFNGNSATGFAGGAIGIEVLNTGSSVSISNDTFNGNTAIGAGGQGAAIYIGAGPVTITNCTIAGNTTAGTGGAVYFENRTPVTTVNNTIIANNTGGNCAYDGGVSFTGGNNLQHGDATCSGVTIADPLLAPLGDNGGATKTMALGAGSAATDSANPSLAPSTDQRGNSRTDGNGDGVTAPDIGSFEAPAVTATTTSRGRHRAVHP
jgi:hypothetical protein